MMSSISRKLKLSLIGIFFLLSAGDLFAQTNSTTRFFIAYEYQNLTVDATVGGVALDSAKIVNPSNPIEVASLITFSVSCASGTDCPVRFTIDGTAPTSSVGILASYGMIISIYQTNNITNFRAIRTGATSAVLNVQFLR